MEPILELVQRDKTIPRRRDQLAREAERATDDEIRRALHAASASESLQEVDNEL